MIERRRHDRRRAFAAGAIGLGGRDRPTDCVVRDLSEGGALLLLDEPRRAPLGFTLAMRGEVRPARVVWRGEAGVGVAFERATAPAAIVSLDAERLRRVGAEQRLADRIARFVRPTRPA